MKVILLQEVRGKGVEGDVVEVARGYAVNYLLPKRMAVEATAGNVKQLEARRHNIEKRETARKAEAASLAASVEGKSITVTMKVGDEGRLYGSVTGQMVADALREQLGIDLDRRKIDVHGHIKTLGAHMVSAQLHKDVRVDLTVDVVGEGGATVAAPAPKAAAPVEEPAAPAEEAVAEETDEDASDDTAEEE